MKESGLNHVLSQKEKAEGSVIKNILQFAFILVLCFWLLYQIHHSLHIREEYACDDIEKKLRNEQIGKILGRKGGIRLAYNSEEMDLYGVDLVRESERIKQVVKDDEENDVRRNNAKGNGEEAAEDEEEEQEESFHNDSNALHWRGFGDYLNKEGDLGEAMPGKKANSSTEDGGESEMMVSEKLSDEYEKVKGTNRSDVESSLAKVGSVILKNDDKTLEVFRFNDENGVPRHDSAPSRRSDIQVESCFNENISSSGNQSKEMEVCQKLCLQNISDKQGLGMPEVKAVHEDINGVTVVESGKESMRELLRKKR